MKERASVNDTGFRFDHVMLPVRDLARAIAFYGDFLAMRVVETRSDPERKVAHMGYGARKTHATVELIEDLTGKVQIATGSGHFCVNVSGLRDLCQRLDAAGFPLDRPLVDRGNGVLRAWVRDPDGHLVEMSEVIRST